MSTIRLFGPVLVALVATVAQAQSAASGSATMTSADRSPPRAARRRAGRAQHAQPPVRRLPAPRVSGSGMTTPDSSACRRRHQRRWPQHRRQWQCGRCRHGRRHVGSGSSATREMGSGAMTDCPMGTSRKMGLCVPYGQERKRQP